MFGRRHLLLVALLGASAGGCTFAGFCCGRATDFDETTRSDRRRVKKEIRKEHAEELEEAAEDLLDDALDRREDDLEAYYAWLSRTLDLPAIWNQTRTQPGFVRAWRITTFDGAHGESGGFASARLTAVPDWSYLVTAALKKKFETEFDKSDRDRLARDLWLGERWAIDHLDAGVPGIDLELSISSEDMPPGFGPVLRVLGSARTDLEGRAVLALTSASVPGNVPPMSYELTARPLNAPAGSPALERDEPAHLSVRRGSPKGVVFVDSDDVLDWTSEASVRVIVDQERFIARDYCVKDALAAIAKTHAVAVISTHPDSREPVFRRGLSASQATDAHPRGLALHFAASRSPIAKGAPRLTPLASLTTSYRDALGPGAVTGLVTSDPALAEAFAQATGLRAWTLASPKDGGWCAGLSGLLAPKK